MILRGLLLLFLLCIAAVIYGITTNENRWILWLGTAGLSLYTFIGFILIATSYNLRGSLPITKRPLDLFLYPRLQRSESENMNYSKDDRIHWVGSEKQVPCIFVKSSSFTTNTTTTTTVAQYSTTPPLIIFAHGNGYSMHDSLDFMELLLYQSCTEEVPMHGAVFEFPGYSCHRNPSTDNPQDFIQACVDVVKYARTEMDYTTIVLLGHSLGAAVTLGACAELEKDQHTKWVHTCITYGAFTRVRDMVAKFLLSDTEAAWFEERYDNCKALKEIKTTSVILMHGKNDDLVPVTHVNILNNCISDQNENSTMQIIETGTHNQIPRTEIISHVRSIIERK